MMMVLMSSLATTLVMLAMFLYDPYLISATFDIEDELFQWQRTFSSHCCSLDVVKGF